MRRIDHNLGSVSGMLRLVLVGLLLALTASSLSAVNADANVFDTTLISRNIFGGPANSGSSQPSVSADGRYVAFTSTAWNLELDARVGITNVFVRDTKTGVTTLVSRANGANGEPADGQSTHPMISADGSTVAFSSFATNLSPDKTDPRNGIYARDLAAGTTTLVSRANGPTGASANNSSSSPSISGDGRRVAFLSLGNNLGTRDGLSSVFVRDLVSDTTTEASVGTNGSPADRPATSPALSLDGRRIAFSTSATNLSIQDNELWPDIYVRDLAAGKTFAASLRDGRKEGEPSNSNLFGTGSSISPSLSSDGRYVAFESNARNLVNGAANAKTNVFVRDTLNNRTFLVGRADGDTGEPANEIATEPTISADGEVVSFQSPASNLSDAAALGKVNVYVRNTDTSRTTLISRASGPNGAGANLDSLDPSLTASGNMAAFSTSASNLSTEDAPDAADVFTRNTTPSPPAAVNNAATTPVVNGGGPGLGGPGSNGSDRTAPTIKANAPARCAAVVVLPTPPLQVNTPI